MLTIWTMYRPRYVHEWLWIQHCEESERSGGDFELEESAEDDRSTNEDRDAELAIQANK